MSNLILEVEVRCHKVQGMTEAFTDTLYTPVHGRELTHDINCSVLDKKDGHEVSYSGT